MNLFGHQNSQNRIRFVHGPADVLIEKQNSLSPSHVLAVSAFIRYVLKLLRIEVLSNVYKI